MEGATTEFIVIVISLVVTGVIMYIQNLKIHYELKLTILRREIEKLEQIIKLVNKINKEKGNDG
jgi:hypothetical protein